MNQNVGGDTSWWQAWIKEEPLIYGKDPSNGKGLIVKDKASHEIKCVKKSDLSSQYILLSPDQIMEETKKIWDKPELKADEKEKILSRIKEVIQKRRERYNNLPWYERIGAAIIGRGRTLGNEDRGIEDLEYSFRQKLATGNSVVDMTISRMDKQFYTGTYLEYGKREVEALKWYEKSAQEGGYESILRIGKVTQKVINSKILKPLGEEETIQKAIKWMLKAAKQRDAIEPKWELVKLYEKLYNLKAASSDDPGAKKEANQALQEAMKWNNWISDDFLKKLPKEEYPQACLLLGKLYRLSNSRNTRYYDDAFRHEHTPPALKAEAAFNLGEMFTETDQSAFYFLKAAELGHKEALNKITQDPKLRKQADSFYLGQIEKKENLEKAVAWFLKGAIDKNLNALYVMGSLYRDGIGVTKDLEKSRSHFLEAATEGHPQAQYNLAALYFVEKKYPEAISWWEKCAKQEDIEAMNKLGKCHEEGTGVPKDETQARKFYKAAADKGSSEGQFNLACLMVSKDEFEEALVYLKKGAKNNYAKAQLLLARLYKKEIPGVPTAKEAFELTKKAADLGLSDALDDLGTWYESGWGSKQQAFEAYKESANKGYSRGQYHLAQCYDQGIGVEKNIKLAIQGFTNAADRGYAYSQVTLADLYLIGNGVEKNYKKAMELYEAAAMQGNAEGQYKLGKHLFALGTVEDTKKGIEWVQKAAAQNNLKARAMLADCYFYGKGIGRDYAESLKLYEKLVDKSPEDQCKIAFMFRNGGFGVQKDLNKALEWYQKAALKNYAPALEALGDLHFSGEGVIKNTKKAIELYEKAAQLEMTPMLISKFGDCYFRILEHENLSSKDYEDYLYAFKESYAAYLNLRKDFNEPLSNEEKLFTAKFFHLTKQPKQRDLMLEELTRNKSEYYPPALFLQGEVNYSDMFDLKASTSEREACRELALSFLKMAAEKDQNIEAMKMLGNIHKISDRDEANKWFLKAADKEDAEALRLLADMHSAQLTLEENPRAAQQIKAWYLRAAKQGDIQALENLKKFKGFDVEQFSNECSRTMLELIGESYEKGMGNVKNDAGLAKWYLETARKRTLK